jgi:hypothetical protein
MRSFIISNLILNQIKEDEIGRALPHMGNIKMHTEFYILGKTALET